MRKHLNKKIAAVALGAVALTGTGVAYAYWTTTGAGTGSATAGADVAADKVQLLQDGALTGFYPGGDAQPVMVNAKNPAAFDQKVGEVTVTVAASGACSADNWAIENTVDAFGVVKAGQTTTTALEVATIRLVETNVNQDVCKGVTPVLTFVSAPGAV